MATSEQIQEWLTLVASARLAAGKAKAAGDHLGQLGEFELSRADEYLESAFIDGLRAHGQAILQEHLDAQQEKSA